MTIPVDAFESKFILESDPHSALSTKYSHENLKSQEKALYLL